MAAFTTPSYPQTTLFGRSGYNKDDDDNTNKATVDQGRSGYNEPLVNAGRSGYNRNGGDDDGNGNGGRSGYN